MPPYYCCYDAPLNRERDICFVYTQYALRTVPEATSTLVIQHKLSEPTSTLEAQLRSLFAAKLDKCYRPCDM
eukprot:5520-Heterococcus_DN1.PRE.4